MAKITRVTQKIFAASAANNGVFGSAQAGTPTDSSSLATIMGGAAWAQGWLNAVLGASKFPPLEEFQGIDYVLSTQIAYILQQGAGIEYDAGTTYYQFSIAAKPGTYQFYGSKTNANVGNALTDTTNWQFLGDLSQLVANVFTGGISTGSANAQTIAATSPATGLTPTDGQMLIFTAGFTNTGALFLTVTSPSIPSTEVKKEVAGSIVSLTGNEVVATDTTYVAWNSSHSCWLLSAGLPLGTAAYKAVSDNTKATVASVNGATTVGHLARFNDTAGTVVDGGATGTFQATPGNPTGTASATNVMMGLGVSFTPAFTGNVLIMASGDIQNSSSSGGGNMQLYFGTGSAPTNGSALTGTAIGSTPTYHGNANTAGSPVPIGSQAIVSLTAGTAYWIDLSLGTGGTGGTVSLQHLSISGHSIG